jgi:hypothetical protein
MTALIETASDGTPEEIRHHVTVGLGGILAAKRKEVAWNRIGQEGLRFGCGSRPGRRPALAPAAVMSLPGLAPISLAMPRLPRGR